MTLNDFKSSQTISNYSKWSKAQIKISKRRSSIFSLEIGKNNSLVYVQIAYWSSVSTKLESIDGKHRCFPDLEIHHSASLPKRN